MFNFGSRSDIAGVGSAQVQSLGGSNGNGASSSREVGMSLRERREAMGVSLAEAESATRIRQKYIAALESDEWHLLPGEVVGRGFLRNYAGYLGLEPTEVIERRRTRAQSSLSGALANTSAGSSLPPIRQVDYRPKEVDLKDEADGMERREIQVGPILRVLAGLALLVLVWFGRVPITSFAANAYDSMRSMAAQIRLPSTTPATGAEETGAAAGVINPANVSGEESIAGAASASAAENRGEAGAESNNAGVEIAQGSSSGSDGGQESQLPVDNQGDLIILVPTATPEPTAEPTLSPDAPTPTATIPPLPTPTNTPAGQPAPAAVAAEAAPAAPPVVEEAPVVEEEVVAPPPLCPDPRAVITAPGVGAVAGGALGVVGTATHEVFDYYKLEYAPGADAGGGFVYFAGGSDAIANGLLGTLDTTALANGAYTLQIVVVDLTGNFPPPCRVSITVQN